MAKTKNVTINEKDFNVGEVINMGASAPVISQIVAETLIKDQIAQLKAVQEVLETRIKGTPYSETVKKLIAEGHIDSEDEKLSIEVLTVYGDTVKISISGGEDDGFEVSKDLADKELMETVVPDKYKKVNITLDKKAMAADYDDGTLPTALKGYCSKCPVEITKIRRSVAKKTK